MEASFKPLYHGYVSARLDIQDNARPNIPHRRHYNAEYGSNVSHSPLGTANTCGDKTANRVITDNGGVFEKVQEHNGEQGWLDGTYCGYDDNDNSNTLSAGDTVYWSTFSENKDRR